MRREWRESAEAGAAAQAVGAARRSRTQPQRGAVINDRRSARISRCSTLLRRKRTARTFGAAFVDSLERRGVLTDGTQISYALSVQVDQRGPHRTVSHGGATGGYQTFLTRFPDVGLSIAVLCNGATMGPAVLARAIADAVLGPVPGAPAAPSATMSAEERARQTTWRHLRTHMPRRSITSPGADFVAVSAWAPEASDLAEFTGT